MNIVFFFSFFLSGLAGLLFVFFAYYYFRSALDNDNKYYLVRSFGISCISIVSAVLFLQYNNLFFIEKIKDLNIFWITGMECVVGMYLIYDSQYLIKYRFVHGLTFEKCLSIMVLLFGLNLFIFGSLLTIFCMVYYSFL